MYLKCNEGGVLSPILFCLYLSKAGGGCYIYTVGNHYSGALCYADDLNLISPSSNSMNLMLNICETFADEY